MYDSSTGIITAPVSIQDIQQALGVSNEKDTELCVSTAINKWARYKPHETNVLYKTVDAAQAGCVSVNCALRMNDTEGFSTIEEIFTNYGNSNWTYIRPTTYAQIGTFAGYCHKAVSPFGSFAISETDVASGASFIVTYSPYSGDSYNVSLSDIGTSTKKLSSCYFAVGIFNTSGTLLAYKSADATYASSGFTFTMNAPSVTATTKCYVIPFFSTEKLDGSTLPSAFYFSLDGVERKELNVGVSSTKISVGFSVISSSSTNCSFNLRLMNSYSTSVYSTQLTWSYVNDDESLGDTVTVGTMSSGATKIIEGFVQQTRGDRSGTVNVVVTYTTGGVTHTDNFSFNFSFG